MSDEIYIANLDGINVANYYRPLETVGGDYFNFRRIGKDKYSIVIADATGHGKQANDLIKEVEKELDKRADLLRMPSALCMVLNSTQLDIKSDEPMYTAFIGVIDTKEKTLTYSSAGHWPQLKYNKEENIVESIRGTGVLLGANIAGFAYEQETIEFKPGDKIILYTDGLFEIMNQKGTHLDLDGIEQIVGRHKQKENQHLIKEVLRERKEYMQTEDERDDVSMAVVCQK